MHWRNDADHLTQARATYILNVLSYAPFQVEGDHRMVVETAGSERLEGAWRTERGPIRVYSYRGGKRVAALLRVTDTDVLLMLNDELLSGGGRRIAMGWALAITSCGAEGFYSIIVRQPPSD